MRTDLRLDKTSMMLGLQGNSIENLCIIELKYYIYVCKLKMIVPTLSGFKKAFQNRAKVEWEMAKNNFRTNQFLERWGRMSEILTY